MFDGLLRHKFYTKCKSCIKLTKVRMEAIRKKRNAVQKYLRNDIADLLRTSLDTNAYGRAEGLLIEMNMSSCYNLIEQFYGCISSKLSVMDKQRECPEDCREAVASLAYAAARFSDLPELRDLRNMFTQRYGNSLEAFVNQEFVEKFKSKPPPKEMKLQLLQEIAQESSIDWDSKALEQKLFNPPPPRNNLKKNGSLDNTNDDGHKWNRSKDDAVPKRHNQDDLSSHRPKEVADNDYKLHSSKEKEDIHEASIDQDGPKNYSNSARTVSKEEADTRKPLYSRLVPPYLKPKAGQYGTTMETPPAGSKASTDSQMRSDGDVNGEENHHHDDSVGEANKPKPRSVRRRNLKPPPGRDNVGTFESDGVAKINSNGMQREEARKGLQTLCTDDRDQKNGGGKVMDGLLIHYRSSDGKHKKPESVAPPARATSLPVEPPSPTEAEKGPHRAISLQPDMINPGGHVHPKLPDYEDLAARFAALRGR